MYVLSFILAMLAPVSIFVVGVYWRVSPPAFQAKGLAYRTALSTKSPDTWAFAHRHCAKLWIRIGLILTILSPILMTVFREHYLNLILWLIGGQMVFLCTSAFLVDILLKNLFDENGNRVV